MPISGLVIRCMPESADEVASLSSALSAIPGLALGARFSHGVAAVLDAPDYARHDASLGALRDVPGVCAVDVVFHDFSDVSEFDRLPERRRDETR